MSYVIAWGILSILLTFVNGHLSLTEQVLLNIMNGMLMISVGLIFEIKDLKNTIKNNKKDGK